MNFSSLCRTVAVLAMFGTPLAGHAAHITVNTTGVIYGDDGQPPAGTLGGSFDFDADSGMVLSARILVWLTGATPTELTFIDPISGSIAKDGDKKPIVIKDKKPPVQGESLDDRHDISIELLVPEPPSFTVPTVLFSGTFHDSFKGTTLSHALRGAATLAVPEPATSLLVVLGLVASTWARRRARPTRAVA